MLTLKPTAFPKGPYCSEQTDAGDAALNAARLRRFDKYAPYEIHHADLKSIYSQRYRLQLFSDKCKYIH